VFHVSAVYFHLQEALVYLLSFFFAGVRQHISSLRGTQDLPEDGNKLPKHVAAQG
jgi:hypothetical protein